MNVTAIIVTRGDVDLTEILESIPEEYERIVWDNGFHGYPHVDIYKDGNDWRPDGYSHGQITDLSVYGRYAAIEHAKGDLIYVQDDDVLHTTQGIEEIVRVSLELSGDLVVNMPANFRHAFYQEHALVGFGACFHRDLPSVAFGRFLVKEFPEVPMIEVHGKGTVARVVPEAVRRFQSLDQDFFTRTCDIVFTGLTPYTMVDIDYQDMPWAWTDNRMWKQPTHRDERGRMLGLVKQVRDAA